LTFVQLLGECSFTPCELSLFRQARAFSDGGVHLTEFEPFSTLTLTFQIAKISIAHGFSASTAPSLEPMAKKRSQLQRFKESLSSITKPSNRKSKKGSAKQSDPDRTERLKQVEEQFNSFDTKFTRSKYEVSGRKVKGKVGKPGINKELSEQIVWFNMNELTTREKMH
jgi:flagellar motor protein MotB